MQNGRKVLNRLALGVICAGALALSPSESTAFDGGTCCDQQGARCYLSVGGQLIIQEGGYYSDGPCKEVE